MTLIPREEITTSRLAETLAAEGITGKADYRHNELYLTDGLDFPAWLMLEGEEPGLRLLTFTGTRRNARREQLLELANRLNEHYVLVRYAIYHLRQEQRDCLIGSCHLPIAQGLHVEQLIDTVRLFTRVFIYSLHQDARPTGLLQ